MAKGINTTIVDDVNRLGSILCILAVGFILNNLVIIQNISGAKSIVISGNIFGWLSSLFLSGYLLLIWLKYESFLKQFEDKDRNILIGTVTMIFGVLFLTLSALQSLDKQFGIDKYSATIFLILALVLFLFTDIFLLARDYTRKKTDTSKYFNKLSYGRYTFGIIIIGLRTLIIITLLGIWTSKEFGSASSSVHNLLDWSISEFQIVHFIYISFAVFSSCLAIFFVWPTDE